MKFHEKLSEIDCRKDTKARRRLNDCGETICNITPNQIEDGVTLEELDNCNTPIHCYSGQLTIHGTMPGFNPNARPGGYKALFLNGNGSIGVRYIAIDAGKKSLIQKACKLADNGWSCNANSTGFEISKNFTVKDESVRQKQKENCLIALKAIPTDKFFGSAFAYTLAYGMGYGCAASIGAIPQDELWGFINQMFNIPNQEELDKLQSIADEKDKKYWEKIRADNEIHAKESKEKEKAFLQLQGKPLFHIPMWENFKFKKFVKNIYDSSKYDAKYTIIAQYKGKWCHCMVDNPDEKIHWSKWIELKAKTYLIWDQKIQQGLLFPI